MRITAFGGKGIGMPTLGLGQVLTNEQFLAFQQANITPHGTIISLSNVKHPERVIAAIKEKIRANYPECTYLSLSPRQTTPATATLQLPWWRIQIGESVVSAFLRVCSGLPRSSFPQCQNVALQHPASCVRFGEFLLLRRTRERHALTMH